MSIKNSNETVGNRSRDLPVCSAVPQPTAPPRAEELTKTTKNLSPVSRGPRRVGNTSTSEHEVGMPPTIMRRSCRHIFWPQFSLSSNYGVPTVTGISMLHWTVLCSSIHSLFTSSCSCFVCCISRFCLIFLQLLPFSGHVTIFRKTCARDLSERRLVQN
jgi:hypothetical protein